MGINYLISLGAFDVKIWQFLVLISPLNFFTDLKYITWRYDTIG